LAIDKGKKTLRTQTSLEIFVVKNYAIVALLQPFFRNSSNVQNPPLRSTDETLSKPQNGCSNYLPMLQTMEHLLQNWRTIIAKIYSYDANMQSMWCKDAKWLQQKSSFYTVNPQMAGDMNLVAPKAALCSTVGKGR
jgi:hypothetical protein